MRRRADWEARLFEFLDQAATRPYTWGVHDCCMFTCDAVWAITGTDPAAPFRGRYADRNSAYRELRRFGGGGLRETAEKIADAHGCPKIRVENAQRGDVVLMDGGGGLTLGFMDLLGLHVLSVMAVGYAAVEVSRGLAAWRIG